MRFTRALPAAALVSGAAAQITPVSPVTTITAPIQNGTIPAPVPTVWVSTVTDSYVYYCPEPTTLVHKNATYTATGPTYITISNCPCTVTYSQTPKTEQPPVVKTETRGGQPTVITQSPVPPPPSKGPVPPAEVPTTVVPENPPAETNPEPGVPISPTTAAPENVSTFVAAADKANAGVGALILAGVAAMVL